MLMSNDWMRNLRLQNFFFAIAYKGIIFRHILENTFFRTLCGKLKKQVVITAFSRQPIIYPNCCPIAPSSRWVSIVIPQGRYKQCTLCLLECFNPHQFVYVWVEVRDTIPIGFSIWLYVYRLYALQRFWASGCGRSSIVCEPGFGL